MLPKSKGGKLSEDWTRAKLATNEKGERVFRFHISTPVTDNNGVVHAGVAVVDISEVQAQEVAKDGNRSTE